MGFFGKIRKGVKHFSKKAHKAVHFAKKGLHGFDTILDYAEKAAPVVSMVSPELGGALMGGVAAGRAGSQLAHSVGSELERHGKKGGRQVGKIGSGGQKALESLRKGDIEGVVGGVSDVVKHGKKLIGIGSDIKGSGTNARDKADSLHRNLQQEIKNYGFNH